MKKTAAIIFARKRSGAHLYAGQHFGSGHVKMIWARIKQSAEFDEALNPPYDNGSARFEGKGKD